MALKDALLTAAAQLLDGPLLDPAPAAWEQAECLALLALLVPDDLLSAEDLERDAVLTLVRGLLARDFSAVENIPLEAHLAAAFAPAHG